MLAVTDSGLATIVVIIVIVGWGGLAWIWYYMLGDHSARRAKRERRRRSKDG
jgi:hypothetical protein